MLDSHRAVLRSSFVDWLVDMEPADVVDVGTGQGDLVASLQERGVRAFGFESSVERVERAKGLERPVEHGNAEALDMPDNGASWVTLRHVLHHLKRPEFAVREALRVARDGVMLAEPITRTALPMHAPAVRMDDALRALDRARGVHHDEDLSPARLVALLPPSARIDVRMIAPMTRLPPAEVLTLIEHSAGGLPIQRPEQEGLAIALEAAEAGWLAPAGSVMVACRLR